MPLGILGKKLGMTQIFDETGNLIPVTLVLAGPCPIIQKRDEERDGYTAVQLGFEEKPERLVVKALKGHFAKAGVKPARLVREFRGEEAAGLQVGEVLDVTMFADGEHVDIIGTSKGRGFTGVYKRRGSRPGPNSHGSMYFNRPGSNGGSSDPSRTYKGKPNSGQFGNSRVTVKNLEIVKRDPERNLLFLRGSVPGANNGYIMIRKRKS
jgi:large subunit ribosomal protein L3